MTDDAESTVQLFGFFVGATEYVIDFMRVEEVLQPQRVAPLSGAPSWIDGVVNLHGARVAVVNLGRRLGESGLPPPRARPKWIVTRVGGRRVVLAVDGVSEVVRTRRSELKPLSTPDVRGARPFVIGATGPADGLKLLLELKAVLRV